MAAVVERSRLFTPADIEFAARRTAQLVFERVLFEQAGGAQLHTADVLRGIAQTAAPSPSRWSREFEQDITDFARV
jgi:transitional endoplasmic reticulum ATPase